MEIEIIQEKLAKALNIVSRVATSTKSTLAILNNVLIRVDDKKVSLTATNLDMAVVYYLATAKAENGVITVPAKLLAEFVGNLPKGEKINLKEQNQKITISADKYKSVINGSLADDFPELPEIDETKAVIYRMGVEEFKNGINEVLVASGNDMTRPALTGVFFNTFEGALYIAATDGYRLAERKFIDKVESEVMVIVPTASLQEVTRSISEEMDEIEILFDESQVRFRLGEIEITSKIIDGKFPDYRQLIPKETEINLILNRNELIRVVKLAALFARQVGGSIICETKSENNSLLISSVANEFGENNSEIPVKVEKDLKVTLNSRFLMDLLNVLNEEELEFGISDKLAPIVVRNRKNKDYTHIIMPLKA